MVPSILYKKNVYITFFIVINKYNNILQLHPSYLGKFFHKYRKFRFIQIHVTSLLQELDWISVNSFLFVLKRSTNWHLTTNFIVIFISFGKNDVVLRKHWKCQPMHFITFYITEYVDSFGVYSKRALKYTYIYS